MKTILILIEISILSTFLVLMIILTGCVANQSILMKNSIDTSFAIAAGYSLDKGQCIPLALKTKIIPQLENIKTQLEIGGITLGHVIELTNEILKQIAPIKLPIAFQVGIKSLIDSLNSIDSSTTILKGSNLKTAMALIDYTLSGLQSAAKVADDYKGWCK